MACSCIDSTGQEMYNKAASDTKNNARPNKIKAIRREREDRSPKEIVGEDSGADIFTCYLQYNTNYSFPTTVFSSMSSRICKAKRKADQNDVYLGNLPKDLPAI